MWAALLHAAQRVEAQLEAALAEHGLSLPKLAILGHLVEAGEPIPLGRLAERRACVKSNITQLVDRLETEGLVERLSDSADRRCVRAAITKAGRERFERGSSIVALLEVEIFGGMSDADRARLARTLAKFGSPCGS